MSWRSSWGVDVVKPGGEHTELVPAFQEAGYTIVRAPRSLYEELSDLKLGVTATGTAHHQPLLFLWAIGQAMAGKDRLQPLSTVRESLVPVFEAHLNSAPVRDPFLALTKTTLWEVTNATDPAAGLIEDVYELFRAEPQVAAEVAANLVLRFFTPMSKGLLADVGMATMLGGRWADALRPITGERALNRTMIKDEYGGNGIAGITRTTDSILTVYSDEKGPYRDSRDAETGLISYVGEGLSGDQTLTRGNKQLQDHREAQRPLRYWHKPYGQNFIFETWVVVVDGRLCWGVGEDKKPRREFCWLLAPVPSPMPESWSAEVKGALEEDTLELPDETADYLPTDLDPTVENETETPEEIYARLNAAANRKVAERAASKKRAWVHRHNRSPAARAAVIQRSGGTCEHEGCYGHSDELTTAGQPILEVDHVVDLAQGGHDEPSNMIALCPNCHALKTRGANRKTLRAVLKHRAKELHAKALGTAASG